MIENAFSIAVIVVLFILASGMLMHGIRTGEVHYLRGKAPIIMKKTPLLYFGWCLVLFIACIFSVLGMIYFVKQLGS